MAEITTIFYRSLLDAHDQAVYDSLLNQWMHYNEVVQIDIPHAPFSDIMHAIHMDIPLLFYVNYYRQMMYYIRGTKMQLKGEYVYPKEKAKKLLEDCKIWGNYIIRSMPSGMSEIQRVLWLHDAVVENVEYWDTDSIQEQNVVGVICNKKAVCAGIAKTYKYLCDLAGQRCMVVTGKLQNELHAWNLVWLEKGPSFIDVTNDLKNGQKKGTRIHFLRSTEQMIGYTWDKSIVPDCKLHNQTDVCRQAHSYEELIRIAKECQTAPSLSIYLCLPLPLTRAEIQEWINQIVLRVPSLMKKSIGFSVEAQQLVFRKA